MRRYNPLHLLVFLPALLLACLGAPAFAADPEVQNAFGLADEEIVVTSSHFPRPASKIAENVTVITAEEIERLNAHTLADVLQTVPGIQLDYLRTPGSFTFFNIQGANNTTVLVLIDGVRQNDFQSNMAEPGAIPVQQIERIEIVKGAASTAWGPALGGVINIVTKEPNPERLASGMLSGSIGERFTADSRAELSGTIDRFGYYLTAGNLRSDGLLPNNAVNFNNLYAKFSYLLPTNGTLTFGYSYLGDRRGMDEGYLASWDIVVHDNSDHRRQYGFLRLDQPLGERFKMEIEGYLTDKFVLATLGYIDNGTVVNDNEIETRDRSRGVNARLNWGDSQKNLVAGLEYLHAEARNRDLVTTDPPIFDRAWDRWALYANGSYTLGPLAVLPGIRVDHTGLSSEYFSYTLGATWRLTENSLLRAYGAQGYGLPTPLTTHGLMKVRTVQAGFESSDIPYLWLKGTYFFNWLRDIESTGDIVLQNQNRQGIELEARTVPLYGFSLSTGYTFSSVKDVDTGERVKSSSQWAVPPHVLKLGLNYDNSDLGLRGSLTGNHVNWNATSGTMYAAAMIWDLHLNWKLCPAKELSPELFFSARNLFDGVQTTDTELYKNTPRWFEGGVRFKF
ncbi:TonB-dependent siderophore receptor [Geobacter sp. OR-1]|uniref:TonB-dependent receptor plug domain-containing protein n=1 Tax=Geobacter sp. OR-1 TaxID=1266765 RepID=UPI0013649A3E|nr:TonB-dependent receptor [Geobacter sp. OR-1]